LQLNLYSRKLTHIDTQVKIVQKASSISKLFACSQKTLIFWSLSSSNSTIYHRSSVFISSQKISTFCFQFVFATFCVNLKFKFIIFLYIRFFFRWWWWWWKKMKRASPSSLHICNNGNFRCVFLCVWLVRDIQSREVKSEHHFFS
jgi:hypothetical protein